MGSFADMTKVRKGLRQISEYRKMIRQKPNKDLYDKGVSDGVEFVWSVISGIEADYQKEEIKDAYIQNDQK